MVDKTNEKSKVSLFKKVFSRHKRKVKDPNHIDDLLDPAEDGCGAIDVSRIRNRARNNRSETTIVNGSLSNENNCDTRNEETDDMSMEKARNMLKVGGSFGFGRISLFPLNRYSRASRTIATQTTMMDAVACVLDSGNSPEFICIREP
jgi:hypothetical protein